MKLHLGVLDQPYLDANAFQSYDAAMRRALGENPFQTTGDVAEHLEARYGVMGVFVEHHGADIAKALETSLQGALETVLMGGPATVDPFAAANSAIEHQFKAFLASGEIESMGIEGVPTKAALQRKSGRFKKGKSPTPRPSFIDTGLYEASAKAWVEP